MPFIKLVEDARRALQVDMVSSARARGWPVTYAHNAVFSTLGAEGSRASDMAARAGITRQSMGEIIRGMVAEGLIELKPDPEDKRAKVVVYTPAGEECAKQGFEHISDLEQTFAEEFGADYEKARRVLARVAELLAKQDDVSQRHPREPSR
jgi:DNA-binding MarR family transcriptional regulator